MEHVDIIIMHAVNSSSVNSFKNYLDISGVMKTGTVTIDVILLELVTEV